jgi:hypothetical protein
LAKFPNKINRPFDNFQCAFNTGYNKATAIATKATTINTVAIIYLLIHLNAIKFFGLKQHMQLKKIGNKLAPK